MGLGECEVRRGEYQAAYEHFTKALENAPSPKGALEGLSQLYAAIGLLDKAQEAAHQLQALEPGSLVAHYVMGYIHLRSGQKEKSAEELRLVIGAPGVSPELAANARILLESLDKGPQ